jgi:hypothetical protein
VHETIGLARDVDLLREEVYWEIFGFVKVFDDDLMKVLGLEKALGETTCESWVVWGKIEGNQRGFIEGKKL